jgi:hypothetical protein
VASDKNSRSARVTAQLHSALLNKTRCAVLMGVLGLVAVIGVRFVAPAYVSLALAAMVVGVVSAFLSVGKTYSGTCPHCGRSVVYTHAYGARSFRCRSCKGRIALSKNDGRMEFLKG